MPKDIDYIVCHYAEIGIKGGNRKFFENALIKNIKSALNQGCFQIIKQDKGKKQNIKDVKFNESNPCYKVKVKRMSGRILIELIGDVDKNELIKVLQNVFGIAYFAFCRKVEADIKIVKNKVLEILKDKDFNSFSIRAKRSDKNFSLTSQEINEQVGAEVIKSLNKKVDLTNPDIEARVDIVDGQALIYTRKINGSGGLPVGVSSKAVSLISGGIDSPVASWYAMKRGVRLVFVHFHAAPYVDKSSITKVKDIVKVLSKFQMQVKLYLVPFAFIQKEIFLKTKDKLRVILYRRFMLRIAEEIAKIEKAKALVTGESIGQVASQTLENITAIKESAATLILRPLIGFDKQEIIAKAQEIGTYNLSILPEQDCCSRFLPRYPETRACLKEVLEQESKIKVNNLVKQAIKDVEIVKII